MSDKTSANQQNTTETEVIEAERDTPNDSERTEAIETARDEQRSSEEKTPDKKKTHKSEPVNGESEASDEGHGWLRHNRIKITDWFVASLLFGVIFLALIMTKTFSEQKYEVWLWISIAFAVCMLAKVLFVALATDDGVDLKLLLLPILFWVVSGIIAWLQIGVALFVLLAGNDDRNTANLVERVFSWPDWIVNLLVTIALVALAVAVFRGVKKSSDKLRKHYSKNAPAAIDTGVILIILVLIVLVWAVGFVGLIEGVLVPFWIAFVFALTVLGCPLILWYTLHKRYCTLRLTGLTVLAGVLIALPIGWSSIY